MERGPLMCGIAGMVTDGRPADPLLLERMLEAIVHRGPDGAGRLCDGPVALGMRRLAVIDPLHGDQPLTSEDGRIVLVGNGEIYGEPALRSALQARGHRFSGGSDLEVVVHLWEELGPAALEQLRGMFAIAVWDGRHGELFCARDRVGKKPLYWTLWDGALRFASEPRAILQDPAVPRDVDPTAIDAFLAGGYVPHGQSAFAALRRLPPGGALRWRPGGQPHVWTWWTPQRSPKLDVTIEQSTTLVREAIEDAVDVRLRADVPLGAFLSGGLDSSVVVAAMARRSGRPVQTYCVGFDEQQFDESPYARRVADHVGAVHHELRVSSVDRELLTRVAWHCGEPFADPAVVPTFQLSELTRQALTVVLTGDGGDEAFAGYRRYAQLARTRPAELIPQGARRGLAAILLRIAGGDEGRAPLPRAARLARRLALDPAARYGDLLAVLPSDLRGELYGPAMRDAVAGHDPLGHLRSAWDAGAGLDWTDRLMEVDRTTYLADDLLPKVDLASMAHGLEVRSPLLDHRLLELAARLPVEHLRGKRILRRIAAEWLPADVVSRPKQGFAVPIGGWLRGDLRGMAEEVLLDPSTLDRGLFRRPAVERLLDEHHRGLDRTLPLWSLLCLELWFRTCVDVATAPPAVVPA